jgi:hypothetical protein
VSLEKIRSIIEPCRQSLLEHPIYRDIRTPAALRTFMEHHVFAVWDFMSLLKALQRRFCCVTVPWVPPTDSASARLVNEIVLGEETDDDGRGGFASHFELYRRAMYGFGADTSQIDRLVRDLAAGLSLDEVLRSAEVDNAVRAFVGHTFAVIKSGDWCAVAAAFTFGREDLLPDVFQKIVDQLDAETGGGLADFQFYLRRHIDLDGGEHGPMALRLVSDICGNDPAKWQSAEDAALASLQARRALWDAIHQKILAIAPAATV